GGGGEKGSGGKGGGVGGGGGGGPRRADQLQLFVVDRPVLGGIVPIPPVKQDSPDDADRAENCERIAPADVGNQPAGDDRRTRRAELHRRQHDSLNEAPLAQGKPAGHDTSIVRQAPRLARAEQKPYDNQQQEAVEQHRNHHQTSLRIPP